MKTLGMPTENRAHFQCDLDADGDETTSRTNAATTVPAVESMYHKTEKLPIVPSSRRSATQRPVDQC